MTIPNKTYCSFLFLISILSVFMYSSCSGSNYQKPGDPLEAGRDFIQFALEGKMEKAKSFILPDADNERLFSEIEKKYAEASNEEKEEYRNASIQKIRFQSLNDSTAILRYSNSYKKEDSKIKLVKTGGEWWVDFKYTFTSDGDAEPGSSQNTLPPQ
ncbi:MAG: hypothetical protein KF862_12930 [Chitinophagaceae bacterium]|nr:hypothetical protein [Chitinophagaceae bacterium]